MYHERTANGKIKRKSFVLWGLESYSCHICLAHSATIHENNLTEKKKKKSSTIHHTRESPKEMNQEKEKEKEKASDCHRKTKAKKKKQN